MTTIGERVEDLMKEKGFTDESLAAEINKRNAPNVVSISKSTIGDIKNNVDKGYSYKYFVALADVFEVSVDYLVGLAKPRSTNPTVQNAVEYTGLSEDAVEKIRSELKSSHVPAELTDLVFLSPMFWNIVTNCYDLLINSREIYHYLNEMQDELNEISKKLEVQPHKLLVYLGNHKKIKFRSDTNYRDQIDTSRYRNYKSIEELSNIFDCRAHIKNANKHDLLKLLSIDESDLEAMKAGD